MNKIVCSECGKKFVPDAVELGEIVSCPSCGTEYVNIFRGFEVLEFEGQDWGE